VVRRHEALRTRFVVREGRPVQVIDQPEPVALARLDGLDEGELRLALLEEARRPFDLLRGPLLRATLARLGEQRWWLLLSLHHIVSDGWSMGVLVREVSAFYRAAVEGTAAKLPDLAVQYADFAR
jgi:Condensation domain